MRTDPSAEDVQEEDVYVNAEVCTVDVRPTSDKKLPAIVRSFAPVVGCWGILLVILVLRIHFTSVMSAKLSDQMKGSEEADQHHQSVMQDLLLTNENLKRENVNLQVQIHNVQQANALLQQDVSNQSENIQQAKEENKRLKEEVQQLRGWTTTEHTSVGWVTPTYGNTTG